MLRWIDKHPSELKVFAANRVNEIHELSNSTDWNYVPTDTNPADIASRGFSAYYEKNPTFWLEGPSWLNKAEQHWPKWIKAISVDDEKLLNEEIKLPKLTDENDEFALVHVLTQKIEPLQIASTQGAINITEAYENLDKMINVIAWVNRAARLFQDRKNELGQTYFHRVLTPSERTNALYLIAKWEQRDHLAQEIKSVYRNDFNMRDRLYRKLPLFINETDGLLRLNGRIKNKNLPYDYKNPIILPPDAIFTKKLFEKAHEITLHGGAQQMLQYIRQKFWIPKARQICSQTITSCTTCKRHDAPISEQQMAPLPVSRTTPGKTFERIGVDYCGPVYLKTKPGRCNTIMKAYICVFVCFITRAVHLELYQI